MVNKIYIYLRNDEELGEIIEKIRKTKEKEIILVVPKGTRSLLHPVNLEFFKNEIEKENKKIYIDTEDEKLIGLARHFKIPLFLIDLEEKPIFDIRPPRKKDKVSVSVSQPSPPPEEEIKRQFSFKSVFKYIFSFIFIASLGFLIWFIFQAKAEVYLETEKNIIELNEVVSLKDNLLSYDYENRLLPGSYVKIELVKTETITTTGKFFYGEKPILNVVFLNYLDREIPLVVGTRLGFGRSVFRLTNGVIVPPFKNNEPGQLKTTAFLDTTEVEDLKIPAQSELEIIALSGKRTSEGKLWSDVLKVKVVENYDLSKKETIATVSSEDITNVKLAVERSLKEAVKTNLAFKYPDAFYYFDPSLVNIEIQNVSHQVGEKSNNISASGKAVFETVVTSKREFDNFVRDLINRKILSENKNLIINNFSYEKINLLDFERNQKKLTLGIYLKAMLMPNINYEALKENLRGKDLDFIQKYFSEKLEGIKKINIRVFPSWKKTFPKDPEKIKIYIQ